MTTDLNSKLVEELAYRESDGIEISMLWNRDDDGLTVLVVDTKRDERFDLRVQPHEAMEVFRHPYAYAAFRSVEPAVFV